MSASQPTLNEDIFYRLASDIELESEPLIALAHLLRACRDDHSQLWESLKDHGCQNDVGARVAALAEHFPAAGTSDELAPDLRAEIAAAIRNPDETGIPQVAIAHAIAALVDERFSHTFGTSFRQRSPYRPAIGDPIPLSNPDLRKVTSKPLTPAPWHLANRLDETCHVRLAGSWVTQFQVVFDYTFSEALAGLINSDTLIATCHPNVGLGDFNLDDDSTGFPVYPRDEVAQRREIDRLIGQACTSGASIVILPELAVTEALAADLRHWVESPDGPRLLIAGSFHHGDEHDDPRLPNRRRNTAKGWVRGHVGEMSHDKHSPADTPMVEDIQPAGWPEIRVHVTADGWHVVIAICKDFLNPHAINALCEAGVNFVAVVAMTEKLWPFGAPASQLVGASQAIVAVANGPIEWAIPGSDTTHRPALALFGHPGMNHMTQLVRTAGSTAGIALLNVKTAHTSWIDDPDQFDADAADPAWLGDFRRIARPPNERHDSEPAVLRPAAVLVLLTPSVDGPQILLTQRSNDLANYPGKWVFPGGAAEVADNDSPAATALREAYEEIGLTPESVEVIGQLQPFALPQTGFLVDPVLAWSIAPQFDGEANDSEVMSLRYQPLTAHSVDADLGAMTVALIDQLKGAFLHQS